MLKAAVAQSVDRTYTYPPQSLTLTAVTTSKPFHDAQHSPY